jgi:ketosteroid isomerase-like protein
MSRENVEVVRQVYEAAARRDAASVMSLYDPAIEWDGSRLAWDGVMPGTAHFHGHDQLRELFRLYYEMWERFEDEAEELLDVGEHVISVVKSRGRGRASGAEVEWSGMTGVWTVRDGKVLRVVWFPSREEALEAVGLRE